MDYISEFLDAMSAAGLSPAKPSEILHTGGAWKPYYLMDDKKKAPKGSYRLTIDDLGAVGQFKCWRDGIVHTWNSKTNKKLTPEEKKEFAIKAKLRQEEFDRQAQEQYENASLEAKKVWRAAVPAIEHPYLSKKGIQAHGAKINEDGDLILPRYDFNGKLWSYQTIDKTGKDKKFQYQGKTSGTFMPLVNKDDDKSLIIISEGFATGASIREATGFFVLVAYSSGNLLDVAIGARQKYPGAQIIMAADNDQFSFKHPRAGAVKDLDKETIDGDDPRWNEWRDSGYLYNTGIERATQAAFKVDGHLTWPDFTPNDLKDKPKDFNDFCILYGNELLKEKFTIKKIETPDLPAHIIETPPDYAYSQEVNQRPDNGMVWLDLCKYKNKRGGILDKDYIMHNAEVLLTHKYPISGCFLYDEFLNKETVVKPLPWDNSDNFYIREVTSFDIVKTQQWLEFEGVRMGKAAVADIIQIVCRNNIINPATNYLDSLIWDKTPRLDYWLAKYMGAKEQPEDYLSRVGSCWLIAAAKRIYSPGTPFHHMLVFEGGQAAMKSTSLQTLATFGKDRPVSYFSDRITFDMIDKADFAVHADGHVILEFQELSGMGKKDRNKIKQWITQNCDEYRRPYDPIPTKYPRKFVLAGTTNESQYLNDPTGDRRFWPVKIGKIDIDALRENREQLWAEAVFRHKQGEKWYIEPNDPVYKLMQIEQSVRYQGDVWEDVITNYIQTKNHVKVEEILTDVLRIETGRQTNIDKNRVCDILRKAGFESKTHYSPTLKKSVRGWVRLIDESEHEDIPF